ncbi:MAG TPA: efflux RND transporter permease subunit, partial [bacterium (Candidatus Stahlbacteria)]|nr:efflux RND transporter permease subunit [Candidatus Stahlbacteria bacterium]
SQRTHSYQKILIDTSKYTKDSVRGVFDALIKGAILVFFILLFFLRDIRPTLIVSLSIPISIFIAFFMMNSAGLTMNIISVGGLTLAVGMIVDNAIVVLENIFRHRERGEDAKTATIEGTKEVGSAIVASTLTTIAVFLPLVFSTGIAKIFFQEMAFTVTAALIASLAVALSLIPMVASRVLTGAGALSGRLYKLSQGFFNWLDERYLRIINWALGNKTIVYSFTIVLFFISLSLLFTGRVGTEFIPMGDSGELSFTLEMPRGTTVEVSEAATERIEAEIVKLVPELEVMRAQTGGEFFLVSGDPSIVDFTIRLVDLDKRKRSTEEVEQVLRRGLNGLIPGARLTFGTVGEMESHFMGGRPISIEITGDNLELTSAFADSVADLMARTSGCVDIDISRKGGKVEYTFEIDRQKAALYGLSTYQIGAQLRSRFEGALASTYRIRGNEFDIRVVADNTDFDGLDKISGINIQSPIGPVPLINLVTLKRGLGPVDIERKDRSRIVKVSCNISGRILGQVVADLNRELPRIPLPPGVNYKISGSAEQMGESFADLGTIMIIAVILVFLVMAAQFESLSDPFVIILSVPLAAIGAMWMLFFTNTTFNIESFLGLIMLAGIVVNNAIVYVTYAKILRGRGMDVTEAVIESGRTRLRPILMTAFTTVIGLIPMAIGMGSGAEMRYPLARAVIGGLLVATLLTLVFIPTFYHTFHRGRALNP